MARRQQRNETVRGEYANGTGWEAGQLAPSTKWIDEDGKVVDKEPKGISRVLVFEGDVVREHMVDAIKASKSSVSVRVDNENSAGDASHSRRRRGADTAPDGTTPPSGAGTTEE